MMSAGNVCIHCEHFAGVKLVNVSADLVNLDHVRPLPPIF